ncbi:nuclear transport factor 2 family protein, partial [Arthrobacter sp. HMWF013]|uniref:nuclear transport factor 2 family protein n=1 Tax=Arthrobacter sp. HMWF013 TaxID=2056849 RepID=UPI000D33D688
EAANLLYSYTEIADRKDVPAVLDLLARARVEFPARTAQGANELAAHFTGLWAAPEAHHHIVSNLIVQPTDEPDTFTARALYTRWLFTPAPVMTTMGEYAMVVVKDGSWHIRDLRVSRSWQLEG